MAGNINSSEYHAFASFTFSATTYYIGTQTELRGGNWYDGVIVTAPQLGMSFGDELSITQGANVDLAIGGDASSAYRALAVNNILAGTQITITLVMRQHWSDNSTTEQVYTQILTIVGHSIQSGQIILHLQDIEQTRLQQTYPFNTWQSGDWPDISSDDAGKPICEPVGTALKFPCPLIRQDVANSEYWYGVCTATHSTLAVTSVTASTKTIVLVNAPLMPMTVGQVVILTSTSGTDAARYTIASQAGTTVVVNETVAANLGSGIASLYVMPVPLTVYRNRRIVAASEYSVQTAFPAAITNGAFTSGGTGWTTTTVGAGASATFTTGNCAITSVNGSNYAYIRQNLTSTTGVFLALSVTVGAGADAVISNAAPPVMTYRLPAGKTTTIFLAAAGAGAPFTGTTLGVWNNTGTANIKSVTSFPLWLTLLKFVQQQVDFNGTNYAIEADCNGVESRNASTEIKRLLLNAGATTDSSSFTAAIGASFSQLVDCDYGRAGARSIDAILNDLLFIARAGLYRTSAGDYGIFQDVATSTSYTYDESLGDPIIVQDYEDPARPNSVTLSYAPSSADANQMQVSLSRAVTGGILGPDQPREIRYLRDATTSDQAICYRALRRWRGRQCTATVYRQQVNAGDQIALTSPRFWPGQKLFTVWNIDRIKSGNKLTLLEYDSAVYTYTAGALPPNAPTGYQPDYSFTPPNAPTALAVTATSARVANDGTTTSYATVQATPPAVNWQQLWFAAVHNVTGEITLGLGASIGGGNYGITLGPLRPGEVYRLQCYAVNSNSVQGVVQSTFNATAIGGGASVTTFTTAGQTAVPPTVASCTAAQAMGKNIRVTWPTVSATNVEQYVLERSDNGGAYAQVHAGLNTTYIDSTILYTHTYAYRVRAQDTYGNFSAAYATSSTVSSSGNVSGGTAGDIGSTTVDTSNRTGVSTVSASYSIAINNIGANVTQTLTHSLGVKPILGAVNSGSMNCWSTVYQVSTSTIGVSLLPMPSNATTSVTINTVPNTHSHNLQSVAVSSTFAVDYW